MEYLVKTHFVSMVDKNYLDFNCKKIVSFSFEPKVGDLLVLNNIKLKLEVISRMLREDGGMMKIQCNVKFLVASNNSKIEIFNEKKLFKEELLSKGFIKIK
ncbi:hypothetical protein K8R66_04255 [bacterium]|nr:hypothetical protein [bacterium]